MKKKGKSHKRGYYIPSLQAKIHPLLHKNKKFSTSRFYQSKFGHGKVITSLKRIGVTKPAKSWCCRDTEQSVINLYTKCQK